MRRVFNDRNNNLQNYENKNFLAYKACQINFTSNCNACFVYPQVNYGGFKDQDDYLCVFCCCCLSYTRCL